MKKIVFCCLVVILLCGCNWGDCYRAFDDPLYTCALFVTNVTDYQIEITHTSQLYPICYVDVIRPFDTCRISTTYEVADSSNSFQNTLLYILQRDNNDTFFVKNKETGDTLFEYTHSDTNKYITNFFKPSDWQYLGGEDDCGIIRARFLLEIKE